MSKWLTLTAKKCRSAPADEPTSVSGWQDSNLRPSAPKADALTGLRYTPNRRTASGVLLVFCCGQFGLQIVNVHHLVLVAVVAIRLLFSYDDLGELLGFSLLRENLIAESLLLCHCSVRSTGDAGIDPKQIDSDGGNHLLGFPVDSVLTKDRIVLLQLEAVR